MQTGLNIDLKTMRKVVCVCGVGYLHAHCMRKAYFFNLALPRVVLVVVLAAALSHSHSEHHFTGNNNTDSVSDSLLERFPLIFTRSVL